MRRYAALDLGDRFVTTHTTTPLRDMSLDEQDGVYLLSDTDLGYVDGAEENLLRIVEQADDRSSMSDELDTSGESWAERYHLTRDRANVMRMLEFSPEDRVLEIGAGCGAVTRYLGEVAAAVDAVEPQRARARVAAARTAGTNARVFCGSLEAVPDQAAWDVVLVNGVLEYVGDGGPDPAPYLEFLRACMARVAPGGVLVVAIENQLGVKYLAGAAEDHGGKPWQGVEGYVVPAPARTFSRTQLDDMLDAAGAPSRRFLHAFPDYKTARTLLTDESLADQALHEIAWRVPRFPSPETGIPGSRAVSERLLWRSLLAAGLADSFANSHVVLCAKDEDSMDTRWPANRLGSYVSTRRRARFCVLTRIERGDEGAHLLRQRIDARESPCLDETELRVANDELHPGRDAAAAIADDDNAFDAIIAGWRRLLDELDETGLTPIDLVPHNLLWDGQAVHSVDQEWFAPISRELLELRGLVLLARELCNLTPADRWPGCHTVGDVATRVAARADRTLDESAWDELLSFETRFQADVTNHERHELAPLIRSELQDRRLDDLELGASRAVDPRPLKAQVDDLEARIALEQQWHRDQVARAEGAEEREREWAGRAADAEAELATVVSSRIWTIAERARRLGRRRAGGSSND
jgi:SAM-dependent methyltransferase